MDQGISFVGMDAHKKAINIALLRPGESRPLEWQVANEPTSVKRLIHKLKRETEGDELRCCYEAGPCGYVLQRQFTAKGVSCEVIAPSLIPRKPGERIKTDRRDARKLAALYRAGLLTVVRPPKEEEESVRDLSRSREDAKEDQGRCRHRLGKFLLRRGFVYRDGKRAWTSRHRLWLRSLTFDDPADKAVFGDYMLALEQVEERIKALEAALARAASTEPLREPVGLLRCFRGIDTVGAMSVVTELHDIQRFPSAPALMAFVGLVPREHSSSDERRRGGITKTGNGHVRRILIEAAWMYRVRPSVQRALKKRREGQPAWAIALADKAQQRLHRRYWRLVEQGKPPHKAVVAVARELIGFLWAVLMEGARVHRGERQPEARMPVAVRRERGAPPALRPSASA